MNVPPLGSLFLCTQEFLSEQERHLCVRPDRPAFLRNTRPLQRNARTGLGGDQHWNAGYGAVYSAVRGDAGHPEVDLPECEQAPGRGPVAVAFWAGWSPVGRRPQGSAPPASGRPLTSPPGGVRVPPPGRRGAPRSAQLLPRSARADERRSARRRAGHCRGGRPDRARPPGRRPGWSVRRVRGGGPGGRRPARRAGRRPGCSP